MARGTKARPAPTPTGEGVVRRTKKELICSIVSKKTKEKFLSDSQREYYNKLTTNQITICSGPAGVGKSYIAMKAAVDLLVDPTTPYEKIIIVRPAVEAEEKLGSLPGGVEDTGSSTVTSRLGGGFKNDPAARAEFYNIARQGCK